MSRKPKEPTPALDLTTLRVKRRSVGGFRVLGVDQSLTYTALRFLEEPKELGAGYSVTTKAGQFVDEVRRLLHIREGVRRVLERCQPDLIVMEGYSFSKHKMAALGELGGMLKLMFAELGFPVIIVPPTVLKKFVTGTGTGDKDKMMMHVFKKWHFEAANNNEADAFGLSKFGQYGLEPESTWSKEFSQLMTKVTGIWPIPKKEKADEIPQNRIWRIRVRRRQRRVSPREDKAAAA